MNGACDGPEPLRLTLGDGRSVSALLDHAEHPFARLALAHGAGAGMTHAFLAAVAGGLAKRGVTTLRYQFAYMEAGSKRPDRPAIAHMAVQAAVAAANGMVPDLPLFAGGKSFGARMTSQAQAGSALPGVRGLVVFGFPLHPAKQPSTARADHLNSVCVPMLFLQGTHDPLADLEHLEPMVANMAAPATLITVAGADHAFHVPVRSGRSDRGVLARLLDETAAWMRRILAGCPIDPGNLV